MYRRSFLACLATLALPHLGPAALTRRSPLRPLGDYDPSSVERVDHVDLRRALEQHLRDRHLSRDPFTGHMSIGGSAYRCRMVPVTDTPGADHELIDLIPTPG